MRNLVSFVSIVALSFATCLSCSKNSPETPENEETETVEGIIESGDEVLSFTAMISLDPSSKAVLEGSKPSFVVGDQVKVLSSNGAYTMFECSNSDETGVATFVQTGFKYREIEYSAGEWCFAKYNESDHMHAEDSKDPELSPMGPYFALYGSAGEESSVIKDGAIELTLQVPVMEIEPGSIKAPIMFASFGETISSSDVAFKNVYALAKVRVPAGVSVQWFSIKETYIDGYACDMISLDLEDGSIMERRRNLTYADQHYLSYRVRNDKDHGKDRVFYIPILPHTFPEGVSFGFIDEDDDEYIGCFDSDEDYCWRKQSGVVKFERNKIYDIGTVQYDPPYFK